MGVAVDQTGEDDGVFETLDQGVRRDGHRSIRPDRGDAAAIVDQHGSIGDRWCIDRQQPWCSEPQAGQPQVQVPPPLPGRNGE